MSRRTWSRILMALAVVVSGLAAVQVATTSADAVDWAFSRSVTVEREHFDEDGALDTESATSNKVTVRVSDTENLRGRQEVRVEWSGAHPTGGVVIDPTATEGKDQEYPVVVLQCRGVDTTGKIPSGQTRLSPENCWTQTAPERYSASSSQTPPWRMDSAATQQNRAPVVGAPDPLPQGCDGLSVPATARWLPLHAASGDVYYGGPDPAAGCASTAPESTDDGGVGLPSNTVYGVTKTDGTGSVEFPIWTRSENATLSCSADTACSLVVVPIAGISCDAWGTRLKNPQVSSTGNPLSAGQKSSADSTCRRTGAYEPGETRDTTRGTDQAVRGSFWWSESNWRHRVTVPLKFAKTGDSCSATSQDEELQVGGSVVLNELTASWRPAFCADKSLTAFNHVQQADFFALSKVDEGTLDAALATDPPDSTPTSTIVPAPLTVGGFAIAFTVDDERGRRQETLNLNARLVAKLITQSYPVTSWLRTDRPDLAANPLNLSVDPEFLALNPGLKSDTDIPSGGAIQLMSERVDLTAALTAWVDADPEARAWIDGAADPWGMKISSYYTGKKLAEIPSFLLDQYEAPAWFKEANRCYGTSPSPYLNLVANPQQNLAAVTVNLQYGSSAVLTSCNFQTDDPLGSLPLRKIGRMAVGQRFVLGLVSLSSASRYNLRTAALQTSSTVPFQQRFSDTSGRTFASGTTAALKAAAAELAVDPDTKTWRVDHAALRASAVKTGYPGVMPVYAAVRTEGLNAATAAGLAKLLCFAVDEKRGLRSGSSNGRLPAGYLALSDANGLGDLRNYTLKAVSAIRNQTKSVPAVDAKDVSYDEVCDFKVAAARPTSAAPATVSPPEVPSAPVDVPVEVAPVSGSAGSESVTTDVVLTAGEQSLLGNIGAPLLLLLALLAGLGGSALRWSNQLGTAARQARRSFGTALGGRHRGS